MVLCFIFVFFKQKTAYEMRISDWSSDVCSSDLGTHLTPVEFLGVVEPGHALDPAHHRQLLANCFAQGAALMKGRTFEEALAKADGDPALARAKKIGRAHVELQSLMRNSYADFCVKKKTT